MPTNLSAYSFVNDNNLCNIGVCFDINESSLTTGTLLPQTGQIRDGGYTPPPTSFTYNPVEIDGEDNIFLNNYLSEGSSISINLSSLSTCVNLATGFDLLNFGYQLFIIEKNIVLERTGMHYYTDTYTTNSICSASFFSNWVLINEGQTYNKILSGTGIDCIPVGTYQNINSPYDILTVIYYTPRPSKYTYVGFGGSTGAYTNEHWIHDFRWTSKFNEINMTDILNNSNLIGSATAIDNSIRLTDTGFDRVGNFFYNLPVYITDSRGQYIDWSAYFVFSMGGGTRGDGLSFILQRTNTRGGVAGGGIGYGGIPNSMGVIYDTYNNEGQGDFSNNNVKLCVEANVSYPLLNLELDLQLCGTTGTDAYRYNWIDYSGADKVLTVYISDNELKPKSPTFSFFIDIGNNVIAN